MLKVEKNTLCWNRIVCDFISRVICQKVFVCLFSAGAEAWDNGFILNHLCPFP